MIGAERRKVINQEKVSRKMSAEMYERSMLQKEQREIKLKALEESLMEECTFSPRSSSPKKFRGTDGTSTEDVFERLYSTETASVKAARLAMRTPKSVESPIRKRLFSPPSSRIEALYSSGQKISGMTVKVGMC